MAKKQSKQSRKTKARKLDQINRAFAQVAKHRPFGAQAMVKKLRGYERHIRGKP